MIDNSELQEDLKSHLESLLSHIKQDDQHLEIDLGIEGDELI